MALRAFKLGKDNWARTRPTKEGILFLGLTFFVGFAAINTGNNLIYLMFGMMLSFIVASGIISMINIGGIDVKLLTPGDTFAMTPFPLKFSLTNLKRLWPSYSITMRIGDKKGYVPHIPSGKARTLTINYMFSNRGLNTVPEARLFSKFPFGFFTKWIRIDLEEIEVLVYPKIADVMVNMDDFKDDIGELKAEELGQGSDIRSLRDYVYGDNPKNIHWKISAKLGKFILREMEDEDSKKVILRFDPVRKGDGLEREISKSASIFLELLDNNYMVEFVSPDRVFNAHETSVSPKPVLTYLALFSF